LIIGSTEERIEKTQALLNSNKVLLDPVFEFNGAVATPLAFDTKTKTILNSSYSAKTKRKLFMKAFYDYSIIKENIEVKDYAIILPSDAFAPKGEIEIEIINKCSTTKGGSYPHVEKDSIINIFNEISGKTNNLPFKELNITLDLIKKSEETAIYEELVNDTTV